MGKQVSRPTENMAKFERFAVGDEVFGGKTVTTVLAASPTGSKWAKCPNRSCKGKGVVHLSLETTAEVRHGGEYAEVVEFTCGHKHNLVVKA